VGYAQARRDLFRSAGPQHCRAAGGPHRADRGLVTSDWTAARSLAAGFFDTPCANRPPPTRWPVRRSIAEVWQLLSRASAVMKPLHPEGLWRPWRLGSQGSGLHRLGDEGACCRGRGKGERAGHIWWFRLTLGARARRAWRTPGPRSAGTCERADLEPPPAMCPASAAGLLKPVDSAGAPRLEKIGKVWQAEPARLWQNLLCGRWVVSCGGAVARCRRISHGGWPFPRP